MVVLLKPLGIGDLVMLSPLFESMSKKFRNIIIVSDHQCIFDGLEPIWLSPKEFSKIDVKGFYVFPSPCASNLIFFLKNPKRYVGNMIRFSKYLASIDFDELKDHYFDRTKAITAPLFIEHERELSYPRIKTEFIDCPEKFACVSPYSTWETRRTSMFKFVELLNNKRGNFEQVLLVGGPGSDEIEYNKKVQDLLMRQNFDVVNLTGATSLQKLSYIISNSSIYLGNDSGPTHIAMISCDCVYLFDGCVPGETRVPKNSNLRRKITFLNKSKNCSHFPCYDGLTEPICKNHIKHQCMQ